MNSQKVQTGSSEAHRAHAEEKGAISIALVTVSDTRSIETDQNGQYLKEQIKKNGDELAAYQLVKDDPQKIDKILEDLAQSSVQLIVFNGGTGISKRDRTIDVIERKLERSIPGFGELFRMLSFKQVGSAAILSRATAGIYKNCVIISIPGSPDAVKLAWEKLIEKEAKHLVWELNR